MKVAFDFPDQRMHRTLFYDKLCAQIANHSTFEADPADSDLVFPTEDTAVETNWPCYGRPSAAYIRGSFDMERYRQYIQTIATTNKAMCVVNMHPFIRLPQIMAAKSKIIVADVNLRSWERSINPRTISMPALPITAGHFDRSAKHIFASFRGVNSHPTRTEIQALHNGTTFICELVERANHVGRLDAEKNHVDIAYVDMLKASVFAFVPRGDAEFSYRLLEVMSFGCIPIVISDGLVLPFDKSIDWCQISLHIPEKDVAQIPSILETLPHARIDTMQEGVLKVYARHFSGMAAVAQSLLSEVEALNLVLAPGTFP